jgi:hypothetical protein
MEGCRLPEDTEAHILFNSYLQAGAQLIDDDDESSYRLSEASRNLAAAQDASGNRDAEGKGSRGADRRQAQPREEKVKWWETVWWKMLQRGEVLQHAGQGCRVPLSREGKLFRLRFRVPWHKFQDIVANLRLLPEPMHWWSERPDATKWPAYPLELKVLATLRILGRAWCFDDITGIICTRVCS